MKKSREVDINDNEYNEVFTTMKDDFDVSKLVDVGEIPSEYNLPAIQAGTEIAPIALESSTDDSINDDFDYARSHIKNAIEKGAEAMQRILLVAASSDEPRAFEVFATLMNSITDANKSLLDVHKKKNDLVDSSSRGDRQVTNNTMNNTIFVGSTSEMSRKLKELKKQEIKTIDNE